MIAEKGCKQKLFKHVMIGDQKNQIRKVFQEWNQKLVKIARDEVLEEGELQAIHQ